MEYWTILWITILGGPLDGEAGYMVYASYDECFAAHKIVSDTFSYDHQIECEVTDVPSSSIRPMPRPEGLGDD